MKRSITLTLLLPMVVVAVLATNASADVQDWTNVGVNNDFGDDSNWSLGPFFDNDDYYINLAGTDKAVLSATHPYSIDDLYVGTTSGDAELEITGGDNTVDNRMRIGRGGSDTILTISGGIVRVPNSYTTWGDDGAAAVTVDGGTVLVDRITMGQKGGGFHSTLDFSAGVITIAPSDPSPSSISGAFRFGGEDDGGDITTQAAEISGSAVFTAQSLFLGNTESSTDVNNPAGVFSINGGEVHLTGSTLAAISLGELADLPTLAFEGTEDLPTVPDGITMPTFLGGIIEMSAGIFDLVGDHTGFINDSITAGYIVPTGPAVSLVPTYDGMVTTVNVVWADGDGNGDGSVDGLDYLLWAANFGDDPADDPPGSPENGDYNDDGAVDGLDYLLWAGNFNQGPLDATAVPEPSTCVLALVGLIGCGLAKSRRRNRR